MGRLTNSDARAGKSRLILLSINPLESGLAFNASQMTGTIVDGTHPNDRFEAIRRLRSAKRSRYL